VRVLVMAIRRSGHLFSQRPHQRDAADHLVRLLRPNKCVF
jgi:hypothetical protein